MSLTVEELFEYDLNKNKNLTKENLYEISLCKLIYFYLIEPKRVLDTDMFGLYLRCSLSDLGCSDKICSDKHEYDLYSLTGKCVRLYIDRFRYQAGVKGKFKSILPGIYEIICRIKLDKNDNYLSYYKERCRRNHKLEKFVECYFYALADHGLDCECDERKMNFDWFESNHSLYGNTNWFNQTNGQGRKWGGGGRDNLPAFENFVFFAQKNEKNCAFESILVTNPYERKRYTLLLPDLEILAVDAPLP